MGVKHLSFGNLDSLAPNSSPLDPSINMGRGV